MSDIIIGDFNHTGINTINVELVCEKWNHLWLVSQWKNDFRLIKYRRIDSANTIIKVSISDIQAKEIINKLLLIKIQGVFKSGSSWKRKIDIDYITKYNFKKLNS